MLELGDGWIVKVDGPDFEEMYYPFSVQPSKEDIIKIIPKWSVTVNVYKKQKSFEVLADINLKDKG